MFKTMTFTCTYNYWIIKPQMHFELLQINVIFSTIAYLCKLDAFSYMSDWLRNPVFTTAVHQLYSRVYTDAMPWGNIHWIGGFFTTSQSLEFTEVHIGDL